jgi:polyhydroxyalkanoate synthesis repressor PhaR
MRTRRILKKYPNRRLYDMTESRYVTLDHALKLVRRRESLSILDSRTGSDITSAVLLQALAERQQRRPAVSQAQVERLIRSL